MNCGIFTPGMEIPVLTGLGGHRVPYGKPTRCLPVMRIRKLRWQLRSVEDVGTVPAKHPPCATGYSYCELFRQYEVVGRFHKRSWIYGQSARLICGYVVYANAGEGGVYLRII